MSFKRFRPFITVLVLVATISLFIYYFVHHPEVRRQLAAIPSGTLLILLALTFAGVGALALITVSTLRICNYRMQGSESALLTSYSAIVNFFGPLQSGPAFRAVYLKKKHGVSLRQYTSATLLYYFFYGAISSLMLVYGIVHNWIIILIAAAVGFALILRKVPQVQKRLKGLDTGAWRMLFLATLLQLFIVTVVYYVELHSVAPQTRVSQAIIYSGAASLALFVSLTPGAIGFRESFLVFSQQLHGISGSTIVAANIIDRAVYISMLLILAVLIFGTHANKQFAAFRTRKALD